MTNLTNHKALITGAYRGIGAAIASAVLAIALIQVYNIKHR